MSSDTQRLLEKANAPSDLRHIGKRTEVLTLKEKRTEREAIELQTLNRRRNELRKLVIQIVSDNPNPNPDAGRRILPVEGEPSTSAENV